MQKVSLAIPIYNVEAYVEKSLASALDQDFEDIEILVIDDRGSDHSMEIVHKIQENHPKGKLIRIIEHPSNLGLGPARNTAIREAQGKYLFFLDSDDWISPDCISHLYRLAEKEQAEVTSGSTVEVCNGQERPLYTLPDQVIRKDAAGVWMNLNGPFLNIEVWNKLFRLDFLRANEILTTHRIMEDSVFDFKVRCLAKVIALSSRTTLYYNVREGSILNNLFGHHATDESIKTYCDIIFRIQELIDERFKDIPGIYDLYCLRLTYMFFSLNKMELSSQQEEYIRTHLWGFIRFIPTLRSLKKGYYRQAALTSLLHHEDWHTFERSYEHRFDFIPRNVSRILSWIR